MDITENILVDKTIGSKRFKHTASLIDGSGMGAEAFTIDDVEVEREDWARQLAEAEAQAETSS